MRKILQRSLPFILAAGLYGCVAQEVLDPAPVETESYDDNVGGSGSIDDCIDNNSGPKIKDAEINHYSVYGNDVSEVAEGLLDLGSGNISASGTTCVLSFVIDKEIVSEYQISETPYNFCTTITVADIQGFYDATVKFPLWEGCDSCWDSYLGDLGEHEQGHVELCKEAVVELEEQVSDASAYFCMKGLPQEEIEEITLGYFHQDVQLRAGMAYDKFQKATEEYDQNTGHDKVQNSVLECE